MERQRYKFDLLTQRFLIHRWETELGQRVYAEILENIRGSADICPILEHYVIEHPENTDPYDFPVYPRDAVQPGTFWVLDPEDLRGLRFYQENLYATRSLTKMQLSFARFYQCNLRCAHLGMTRLSYAGFEACDLREAVFAHSEGIATRFVGSDLEHACLLGAEFIAPNLCGSDCRGMYLEGAKLQDMRVDYQTRFDMSLLRRWKNRCIPLQQLPDLYHSLRMAYQQADIWHIADRYLLRERTAHRKFIRWPQIARHFSPKAAWLWLRDIAWAWMAGYGTRPSRLVSLSVLISAGYALAYYLIGGPGESSDFSSALYFSFTTFATLGYGDLSYGPGHPWMRLLSTSEAWVGAIVIALFVAVMARKLLR